MVALGQQGSSWVCGSGGSLVVLDGDGGPEPLLVAAGAGYAGYGEKKFGRGNTNQTAIGNERIGKSGIQEFFPGDEKDVYLAGAGYSEAPQVSKLAEGCVPPKSYRNGLTGGYGVGLGGVKEGGFGGGGGYYRREVNGEEKYYHGAGGGFTGGSTKVHGNGWQCWGGGGGSFSADTNAKFEHNTVEYGSCKININQ